MQPPGDPKREIIAVVKLVEALEQNCYINSPFWNTFLPDDTFVFILVAVKEKQLVQDKTAMKIFVLDADQTDSSARLQIVLAQLDSALVAG